MKGFCGIVNYTDDFVCCFQYKEEAERFYERLKHRMEHFGLSLAEEKSRLIEFGRFAEVNRKKRGTGLPCEERKKKRQDASRPILDAFWTWVEKTSGMYTTNESLTKALNYAVNQKQHLETFMEDGRLPISNNLCEANIKPFATARRAWLFADTPKGAFANGVLCFNQKIFASILISLLKLRKRMLHAGFLSARGK